VQLANVIQARGLIDPSPRSLLTTKASLCRWARLVYAVQTSEQAAHLTSSMVCAATMACQTAEHRLNPQGIWQSLWVK